MAQKRTGSRKPGEAATKESKRARAGGPVECPVGFCPIGMVLTATGQARPDVVEHLLKAGREFILAAQALIESRADLITRESSLQKIEVD